MLHCPKCVRIRCYLLFALIEDFTLFLADRDVTFHRLRGHLCRQKQHKRLFQIKAQLVACLTEVEKTGQRPTRLSFWDLVNGRSATDAIEFYHTEYTKVQRLNKFWPSGESADSELLVWHQREAQKLIVKAEVQFSILFNSRDRGRTTKLAKGYRETEN